MVPLIIILPMASAMTVLPLPGGPKRKMDLPELTAGPSWAKTSSLMTRWGKGLAHRPLVDDDLPQGLLTDGVAVHCQGDRRRARVVTAVQCLAGHQPPLVGDSILVGRLGEPSGPLDLAEFLPLEKLQDLVHHSGIGEFHPLRQFVAGEETFKV
jgi:hypothetical protein